MRNDRRYVRLNEAFLYVDDALLDFVERKKRVRKRKRPVGAFLSTVAACICLLFALPAAAMAYNWFGLRDLLMPGEITEHALVTLSGYQSSPEAKALAEWNAFVAGYDVEAAIGTGNEVFVAEGRDDWTLYAVYNQEMGEKLDEIAEKYQLKLYSDINSVSPEEMEYRVGGNFMNDCTRYWGYIYEDGSFGFSGDVLLAGSETTDFQFGRAVKGTLGEAILNIGQVEEYAQWQYESSCGEPVLLALGPSKALIFADFEECFVSVNVLSGSEAGMTKEDLQELADRIDFTVLKNVKTPDMRGDSEVPEEENIQQSTKAEEMVSETQVLELGHVGDLGLGYVVCAVPGTEDEDYKLYFFSAENRQEDIAKPFSEIEFNLETADYVFPDVRENNVSIGRFLDIYFLDMTEILGSGKRELVSIARYDVGGEIHYDTRTYMQSENGYCADEKLMQELNGKYGDVEEYPIAELFDMPHD